MTTAPANLLSLASYWKANHGVYLGIVGDTSHLVKGVSYHLGKDDLRPGAYSAVTARDRAGLSVYASAIDLGKLRNSYTELRRFSVWLVGECRANRADTRDIREVIYTPDGRTVYGWNREAGVGSAPIRDYGDSSHLIHTHISFYRDSRARDQRGPFRRYFAVPTPTPGVKPMGPFTTPEQPTQVLLREDPKRPGHSVWLYTTDALVADDPHRVSLDPKPFRPLRHVGTTPAGVVIVAYEPAGGDPNATSTAMYLALGGVSSFQPVVPANPDCSAAIAADRAKARIVYG